MDIIEDTQTRRNISVFRRDPVPRKVLQELLDIGRLSCPVRSQQTGNFAFFYLRRYIIHGCETTVTLGGIRNACNIRHKSIHNL